MRRMLTLTLALVLCACVSPAPSADVSATVESAVRATVLAKPAERIVVEVTAPCPTVESEALVSTATLAPTASDVPHEMLSHRHYTQLGILYIVGEVRNNTERPAEYVIIYATLYDKSNQVIGTGMGVASPAVIQPGETNPFTVVATEWAGLDHYKLQVEYH